MSQYTIGSLSLFNSVGSATHIGMTNIGFPSNAEVSDDESGSLYSEALSITGFSPVATITTKQWPTLMSFVGLNGQCVGSGLAVSQVDVLSRRLETCKSPLTGTPHLRKRVAVGLLRWATLNAPRGQDATLSAILDTFTDGTNGPVAVTDGVAAVTPVVRSRYTLGVPSIAGVAFPEIDDISLEFNVGISDKTPSLGSIWADSAGVLTVRPVLTLTGHDLSRVKTGLIELGATAATHANTVLRFIKRINSGSFESFGSSVHVTLTLAGLVVPEDLESASANQRGTNRLRLAAAWDGTNAPVAINLATTYTPP